LESVARGGIFNMPNLTPFESAMKVNLYDAFHWLSYNKAQNTPAE